LENKVFDFIDARCDREVVQMNLKATSLEGALDWFQESRYRIWWRTLVIMMMKWTYIFRKLRELLDYLSDCYSIRKDPALRIITKFGLHSF